MGLATLVLQEPKIDGLYSPGGGFEIVATGTITAPELPADANKFYLIVQDFKQGSSDSANGGYGKPIAAVFALYKSTYNDNFPYFPFILHLALFKVSFPLWFSIFILSSDFSCFLLISHRQISLNFADLIL